MGDLETGHGIYIYIYIYARTHTHTTHTPLTHLYNSVRCTRMQWNADLFEDESRFNRSFADGRMRVWLRCGGLFADCCIRQHNWFCDGCIEVCREFNFSHRFPLHVFLENVLAVTYRDGVLDALAAAAFTHHPDLQLHLQDNRTHFAEM